jgi:hypothetical protein
MRIAGFDAADLVGGLLITVSGVALLIGAATYPIGTLHRMGPGYLPLVTAVILTGLGVALIAVSRATSTELPSITLRPAWAIFGGLLWFALTIERFGLLPSIAGMVVLTSLAQERPSWIKMSATATFLLALSIGVFIYALRGPLDIVRF